VAGKEIAVKKYVVRLQGKRVKKFVTKG